MSNFKHLLKFVFFAIPFLLKGQVSFMPISADYSVFNMNDSLAYVEFYTSFLAIIIKDSWIYTINGDSNIKSMEKN